MENKGKMSWIVRMLLLAAMSLMLLIVVALAVAIVFGYSYEGINAQLTTIALQNVLVFIAPVLILALMLQALEKVPVATTMWMTKAPTFRSIAVVVLVYIVALPAMNWLVEWNEGLHLPQALHDVETILRDMEDSAQNITTALLTTHSWGMMALLVLLVGVLTGMGEEIFFRAGLLGSMHAGKVRRHVAVWAVAFIFSAIHMQFFGFFPRLLLGAWFGYVMLHCGEVWTPIIAHSLNNGLVVLFTFLDKNHYIDNNVLESLGTAGPGQVPWLAIASAVVTAVVIFLFMNTKKGEKFKS